MDRSYVGFSKATDRRRRRLAFTGLADETDDPELEGLWNTDVRESSVSEVVTADRLLNRLVSQRAFKLWMTAAVLIALAVLSVWLDWVTGRGTTPVRSSMSGLLQTSTAGCSFSRAFSAVSLFLVGQAAILIGWVRSGSDFDFRGHYRVWKWFGGANILISAIVLTGLYVAMTDIAAGLLEPFIGNVRRARPALLIVPTSLAGLVILMRVIPDMRRCRSSQALLAAGLLVALSRIGWLFNPASHLDDVMSNSLLAGASWLLLASMMRHAWFVTHFCNDPPVELARPKSKTAKARKAKRDAAAASEANVAEQPQKSETTPEVAAKVKNSAVATGKSNASNNDGGKPEPATPAVRDASRKTSKRKTPQQPKHEPRQEPEPEPEEVAGSVEDTREARRARKRAKNAQRRAKRKAG